MEPSTSSIREALGRRYPEASDPDWPLQDVLHLHGSPLDALLYASLFCPEFVEHDGMVFLADAMDEEARARATARLRATGDRAATERAFNYFEISGLFGPKVGDTTEHEDHLLASILAEAWTARLDALYFPRKFLAEVVEPDEANDVGIVFARVSD